MRAGRQAMALGLLLGVAVAAHAGSAIYQCGPGQYSERPCGGGLYIPKQAIRQPTAEERQAATEVARRDKQLGRDLQAQRERMEREGARRTAASLSPDAGEAQHKGKSRKKKVKEKSGKDRHRQPSGQQDGDFRAVSPAR